VTRTYYAAIAATWLTCLLFLSLGTARAATFPEWPQITIAEIKRPIPEWQHVGPVGAVQPKDPSRPLPAACAVRDERGQLVGYTLACQDRK
jgi:hypothetical protein